MRMVIACCGLEHTRRGYESFARELFGALSGQVDVTLCKGSGKRQPNEVVVPCLRRNFLARFMNPQTAYRWEQITFAIALFPYLILKKVDLVHYSDGTAGNILGRLVRFTGSRVKLLLSNGGPYSAQHLRPDIFIQQICGECYKEALAFGIAPERMRLVPYGINPEQFRSSESREAAREQFSLPRDSFVILSVAALNRSAKRLDYLIREVAALRDNSVFLCIAGQPTPETPGLRELAAELLPGRHIIVTVPRARIPTLLAAADLFVLPSLAEGLPMVLLEACSSGVPVISHNTSHFQWALGDAALYIDMAAPGALVSKIQEVASQPEVLRRFSVLGKTRAENCYSWNVLIPRYLKMYESVLSAWR
jgi:glycosyltransferase involved in cell wall biosynthesis